MHNYVEKQLSYELVENEHFPLFGSTEFTLLTSASALS